ncbi:hypothetical protein K6M90_02125 [Rhizobium sp. 9T]|uniref:Uncharacterized protein n=1 Tax=Rhizobium croatiense TaxID=2867516 RepID=A0ABS7LWS7_9HYPH|nr:hypothetical protein [Rhizobium croatiense]MBY4606470.1 hypothetical protein [Rhizobium croatiense]MBY4629299.1 hypothetical protein [Rhizobium croatiense]
MPIVVSPWLSKKNRKKPEQFQPYEIAAGAVGAKIWNSVAAHRLVRGRNPETWSRK